MKHHTARGGGVAIMYKTKQKLILKSSWKAKLFENIDVTVSSSSTVKLAVINRPPRCDATRRDATRRDATRRDATRRDATRRDATRRDATRRDATRRDATRRDATRRDATRRDATRRDANNINTFKPVYHVMFHFVL